MPKWKGFIGGFNAPLAVTGDGEDLVNMIYERLPENAANDACLLSIPGQRLFAQPTFATGGRGMLYADGRLFTVVGSSLIETDVNGLMTDRSTVPLKNDGKRAYLIYNGIHNGQLGICSGGNIYSYQLATNVLAITVLVGGFTHLDYAGGTGLAFRGDGDRAVFESNENDFTTWDLSIFFTRSLFGDPWLAMFVDANNLVWMVGSETFEVWQNTGVGSQPWAPLSGLVGKQGIVGPHAFGTSAAGNSWVAANREGIGQLVLVTGQSPEPVSSYAVNAQFEKYLREHGIDDAELLTYAQGGHTFALPTFTKADRTWAYDIELQSWARRGVWNTQTFDFDLWGPRAHCIAYGRHLVLDRGTGALAELDTTIATELDGSGIVRLRRAPSLINERKRFSIDQLMLLMDTGDATQSGQGAMPSVMLRISENGGKTWGNELACGAGGVGEWQKRVYWTQLGQSDRFMAEIRFSDPIPWRITDAYINNLEASMSPPAAA